MASQEEKTIEPSSHLPARASKLEDSSWVSEYRREFTWKTPLVPSIFPDIKTESIQTSSIPTIDDAVQTQPVTLSSITVMDEKVHQGSSPIIQQSTITSPISISRPTETVQIQTESIKTILKAPTAPTKTAVSPPRVNKATTRSKSPLMPYGYGNVNPVVPQNYLKTFNINAPSEEIYPNTRERGLRTKEFVTNVLSPTPQPTQADTAANVSSKISHTKSSHGTQTPESPSRNIDELKQPSASLANQQKDALALYLKARKEVEYLQQRFKTEYASQFKDWYHERPNAPLVQRNIKIGQVETAAPKLSTQAWRAQPAGLPSSYVPHQHFQKSQKDKRNKDGELWLLGPPWSNIWSNNNETSTSAPLLVQKPTVESKPSAGVSDDIVFKHHEKRHYDVEYKATEGDVFPSAESNSHRAGLPTAVLSKHKEKRHYDIEYKSTDEDIFPSSMPTRKAAWAPNTEDSPVQSGDQISPTSISSGTSGGVSPSKQTAPSPIKSSSIREESGLSSEEPKSASPTTKKQVSPTKQQIVRFAVEPPQTWSLAQDLLARAKQKELEQQQSPLSPSQEAAIPSKLKTPDVA